MLYNEKLLHIMKCEDSTKSAVGYVGFSTCNEIDVTSTTVALFLTNIIQLKPFDEYPFPNCQESLVLLQ